MTEREEIIANARLIRQTLCDTTALAEEKDKLHQELAVLVEMTEKAVMQNARITQDQEEYQRHYDGLVARYDAAKARFYEVTEAISAKKSQAERLAMFEGTLKSPTQACGGVRQPALGKHDARFYKVRHFLPSFYFTY